MSDQTEWRVSDTANICFSNVVSGVSGVASSVSHGVGDMVTSVTSGMGDVVQNVSLGVGDTVHSVTAGMKRLITAPPDVCTEEECPGILPSTPRNASPSPITDSSYSDQSPGTDHDITEEDAAINDELGLTEDHFSQPEENILYMSAASLEASIEKCKCLILQCEESTSRRRALVHKLIQLRFRLQEMADAAEISSTGVVFHMSHQLQPQKPPLTRATKQYCDKCAQIIWGVIHVSYVCALCEFRCHGRCVDGILRRCASVKVTEDASYNFHICPEVGLSVQNYKCAECKRLITNKYTVITKSGTKKCQAHPRGVSCLGDPFRKENAWCEPRRCDYTGLYYCPACHWNSRLVVPARVIHNWDFEERLVSRQAKQFLLLMKNKPILHLEKLNPHLFKFVEELIVLKKLREDVLVMKQYLGTCRTAQESRMLRQLEERQHFVENAHMYSLQDLIDVDSGVLVDYLAKIHSGFSVHIKKDCLVCQGKGFICEICDVSEIIFPFDAGVVVCSKCSAVLHQQCYTSKRSSCPKCKRQEARRKQDLKN